MIAGPRIKRLADLPQVVDARDSVGSWPGASQDGQGHRRQQGQRENHDHEFKPAKGLP